MFKAFTRRALPGLVAVAAISVVLAGPESAVALASGGSGPYWGTATPVTTAGMAFFTTAACPSADSCIVAGEADELGSGSSGVPVVAAEKDGSWGYGTTAPLSGGSSASGVYLSVSCMNPTSCIGVGYSQSSEAPIAGSLSVSGTAVTPGTASIVALPSSPTPNSTEMAGFSSISCTATSCTAVGFYKTSAAQEEPMVATTTGGGSWSVASVAPPAAATGGANLAAVSCPTTGACEAVGNYLDASNHIQSWSVQLAGGAVPQTLTLPPNAVPDPGPLPASPSPFGGGSSEAMSAISCPNAAACTAVGGYSVSGGSLDPMVFSIGNGAPTAGVAMPVAGGVALNLLPAIWCSDASNCTVAGDAITSGGVTDIPGTAYEAAGKWSTLTELPGGAPGVLQSLALGLGCSAIDSCLVVGYQLNVQVLSALPLVDFSAPPLSVTTSSLPAATDGVPFSATLQAAGGTGTGTWSVSGSLPAGLSLNTSTGVISGTPAVPGTSSFSVQLASAGPPAQTASVNLSISVAAVPKLSAGSMEVSPNGLTMQIGCSGSGTCSGAATVVAVEHLNGKKPTAVTPRVKHRTVKLTLASGSYSVAAGQLGSISLRLTAKARTLLKRLHTIKGTLLITPSGAAAPTVIRAVTFKSATKKK